MSHFARELFYSHYVDALLVNDNKNSSFFFSLFSDMRGNGCRQFHFMPRFARRLPNNGKEILSMHHVIQYLLKMGKPIMDADQLEDWLECDGETWRSYAGRFKNMIATCPGKVRGQRKYLEVPANHCNKVTVSLTLVPWALELHLGAQTIQEHRYKLVKITDASRHSIYLETQSLCVRVRHWLVKWLLGVARKLIGNALPIFARVGKVNLAVNLGYIAGLCPKN